MNRLVNLFADDAPPSIPDASNYPHNVARLNHASAPSRGLVLQRAVIALRGTVRGDHPGSLVEGPVSDPLGGDRRRRGEDDQRGGADEGANH